MVKLAFIPPPGFPSSMNWRGVEFSGIRGLPVRNLDSIELWERRQRSAVVKDAMTAAEERTAQLGALGLSMDPVKNLDMNRLYPVLIMDKKEARIASLVSGGEGGSACGAPLFPPTVASLRIRIRLLPRACPQCTFTITKITPDCQMCHAPVTHLGHAAERKATIRANEVWALAEKKGHAKPLAGPKSPNGTEKRVKKVSDEDLEHSNGMHDAVQGPVDATSSPTHQVVPELEATAVSDVVAAALEPALRSFVKENGAKEENRIIVVDDSETESDEVGVLGGGVGAGKRKRIDDDDDDDAKIN